MGRRWWCADTIVPLLGLPVVALGGVVIAGQWCGVSFWRRRRPRRLNVCRDRERDRRGKRCRQGKEGVPWQYGEHVLHPKVRGTEWGGAAWRRPRKDSRQPLLNALAATDSPQATKPDTQNRHRCRFWDWTTRGDRPEGDIGKTDLIF